MRKLFVPVALILLLIAAPNFTYGQSKISVSFQVDFDGPNHKFLVSMSIQGIKRDSLLLKMPAWTPGYYQLLHFADNVSGLKITNTQGKEISFIKSGRNGWKFASGKEDQFTISYEVKATRSFVATPYVDVYRAYIEPTGVFMFVNGMMNQPSTVSINLPNEWTAATGLEPVKNSKNQFSASDFDVLYDSPILCGILEEIPSFEVKGIKHRFTGYKLGDFDKTAFSGDMKKIVEEGAAVIGDIPYMHYTFLAIGPGPGGIEHLNSTTFGFSGNSLKTDEGKKRMYTFLAHEYFHHYNVKRIRPIELGPFDYDKENRTNMLWVSEGITVYYDELIARRAGLLTDDDLLKGLRGRLLGYENKPGRLYQSATQASFNTWSDGPFGRSEDEINKTVSVYDKGAILGLMLDFNIRHLTKNKKSLDDVMRALYKEYYQQKKRGFTEAEFQATCESIAGSKLTELFEYVSTVKPPDYKKYFAYGGLSIDTEPKPVEGAWLGITARMRNDSLMVSNVEYESPAWKAGVRRRMAILQVGGESRKSLDPMMADRKEGEKVALQIFQKGRSSEVNVELTKKIEPDFKITVVASPTELQKEILKSWTSSHVK
ncbi:peptidase M61 [Cytophagales bacterium WSM2-2]|nr:peptidase M61 [Cytophagales bacterium WSM2-2]